MQSVSQHAGQRCSYKYVSYLILIQCYSHFCVSLIRNYLFTFVEGARNFEPAILGLYHSTYIWNFLEDCEVPWHDDSKLVYKPRIVISNIFYEYQSTKLNQKYQFSIVFLSDYIYA